MKYSICINLKKISRENIQKNLPNPTYAFDSFWQGGAILVVACRSLARRCLVITAVTTNTGLLRVFSVCLNLRFRGRQSTVSMDFHALSPYRLFISESFHLFEPITNFLGLLRPVYA